MRAKPNPTDGRPQDETGAGRCREIAAARQRIGKYAPLNMSVSFRRQTPEEERQFGDAVKLFLSEIVRQHMRQDQK